LYPLEPLQREDLDLGESRLGVGAEERSAVVHLGGCAWCGVRITFGLVERGRGVGREVFRRGFWVAFVGVRFRSRLVLNWLE